jgi:excisionase family DNA binding protein
MGAEPPPEILSADLTTCRSGNSLAMNAHELPVSDVGRTAPRLLTGDEVADALGCSIRTVMRMAARGELRQITIGKRLRRYSIDDVVALAAPANNERQAATPGARNKRDLPRHEPA